MKENFTEPDVSKFLWIKSEHIISEIRKKETRKEICEMRGADYRGKTETKKSERF